MGNCSRSNAKAPVILSKRSEYVCKKSTLRDQMIPPSLTEPVLAESPVEKTSEDRWLIKKSLQSHFIFSSLSKTDQDTLIDSIRRNNIEANQILFKQGQSASHFYIVNSGKLEIIVNNKSKGHIGKRHCFGELALMHDSKRTATVRSAEKSSLWSIDRATFRRAIQSITEKNYVENKKFIESVPLFKMLTPEQKENLLILLVTQEYTDGQRIVVEGDPGDLFYIVKEGMVRCTKNGEEIRKLNPGEFFGEQALLYDGLRTATVISVGYTHILSLGRQQLTTVLDDHLHDIVYRNTLKMCLEKSSVFVGLQKSQMARLIEHIKVKTYSKSEVVISPQDSKGKAVWLILKGSISSPSETKEVFDCIGDNEILHKNYESFQDEFIANSETHVGIIEVDDLERCLEGPLSKILKKNKLLKILKKVQLLRTLPKTLLEALTDVLKVEEIPKNHTIFSVDDPGDSIYIVKEGQVFIIREGITIRAVGKHDFFGERSIILNENRTASAFTKDAAKVWVLSKQDFLHLIEEKTRTQLYKRIQLQNDKIMLSDLEFVRILGKGMYGTVYLAHKNSIMYALKAVLRKKISAYNIYDNLIHEREILLQLDHPFIVKLVKTYKDPKRLYFLMEFVRGLDLFDIMRSLIYMNNKTVKFYAACLILILEHLHERHIIYRDLKPENIIIDEEGYPKLIDFGTAKMILNRTYTFVGTPHYIAPEVVLGKGYSLAADYWGLGAIIYECVTGRVPFGEDEEDPFKVYQKIVESNYRLPNSKAVPIITKLLSKNPAMRGNYLRIKSHNWFARTDWNKLISKHQTPPYLPEYPFVDLNQGSHKRLDQVFATQEEAEIKELPHITHLPPSENWDECF